MDPICRPQQTPSPSLRSSALAKSLAASVTARDKRRDSLADKLLARTKSAKGKLKPLTKLLSQEVQKADSLAAPLDSMRNGTINMDSDKFPALRLLIDAANEREDLVALGAVLADNSLLAVSTKRSRKAIMEIDYSYFGPQIST